MSLLLIRHGETDFNATRVVQFPDTPLGAEGERQAARLGETLAQRTIGLVLSSDYARARRTAEHVVRHTRAPLVERASLRERNFGDLRGRAYADLGNLDIFARDYEPPGGESWETFDARVDRAWAEIGEHAVGIEGDVVVVTHGLVLRSLLERVLDVTGHVLEPELTVANTSVTIVDRTSPWRVRTLANVDHLDGGANEVAAV